MEGAGPADAHTGLGTNGSLLIQDACDTPYHLLGRAPRKGQKQDAAGIGTVPDKLRHPMRERLSLARAGARNDQ
jgi:hypothetical protein